MMKRSIHRMVSVCAWCAMLLVAMPIVAGAEQYSSLTNRADIEHSISVRSSSGNNSAWSAGALGGEIRTGLASSSITALNAINFSVIDIGCCEVCDAVPQRD